MPVTYEAKNLNELAEAFEIFASDQRGAIRWQTTQRAKRDCEIKAVVWTDAATIIRNTKLG